MLTENQYQELVQKLQANKIWFLVLGILLVAGGFFALTYSFIATIVVMYFLGGFLMATGLLQLFHSFYIKETISVFTLSVLWSVVYLVAGICLFLVPIESASALALLLGILLIVFGLSRLFYGYQLRKMVGSQWFYFTAVLDILFGIIIISAWPFSGMVFGIIMGADLLMQGLSFIMIFFAIKKDSFKA